VTTERSVSEKQTARATWTPLAALVAGIFVLVLSEFLPASVLPAMAADVGVSEGTAGLAVAATAIAGACTAPSIAVILPRADRRRVLVVLLAAGVLSNMAVAIAPNFGVLLAGRLVIGVAIAGFWSFAFGAGTHALAGRAGAVSTGLAFGVSLATVVGIPLASLVGDVVGWRTSFGGAAALTALIAVGLAAGLPPVPAHAAAGLTMLRQAMAQPRLMAGVGCVLLVAFGNFAAYPFIKLAIERVDPVAGTGLLLAWGLGGVVGSPCAGIRITVGDTGRWRRLPRRAPSRPATPAGRPRGAPRMPY
jgi:predicted MFS family arabinose efflux permease